VDIEQAERRLIDKEQSEEARCKEYRDCREAIWYRVQCQGFQFIFFFDRPFPFLCEIDNIKLTHDLKTFDTRQK